MTKNPTTVSVATGDLSAAIAWATKGVSRNPALASEGAVSIILEGNTMTFKAFDGSSYFEFKVSAARPSMDDGRDASVAINGPTLASATKVLRGGDVRIEFEKEKIVLRTGRSHFSLPTLKVSKITVPNVADSVGTVNAEDIKQAVSQVEGAASKDETLAGLTGILVEFQPSTSTLRFVACDRYQLAVRDIGYAPNEENTGVSGEDSDEVMKVLVPAKELKKLVTGVDSGAILELHASKENAFFGLSAPSQSGYVNVFSEQYVAYQRLLVDEYPNRMVVNHKELKTALTDVGVMISGHDAIYLHIYEGVLRVHNAADDSEVEIDATIEGDDPELNEDFSFSKEYLTTALNSATSKEVSFDFRQSGRPVVIREVDDEGKNIASWLHLAMPRSK